jgi:hypothetical protein
MATATNKNAYITPIQKYREFYEEKKGLFGLISWNVVVKREIIGEKLIIAMERIPEDVYVNGIKYKPE